MRKIVLSEPYSPSSYCWDKLKDRCSKKDVSIEKIIDLYQGFEGNLIKMFIFSENPSEQLSLIEKCRLLSLSDGNNITIVLDDFDSVPEEIKKYVQFMGFDVGICDEDHGFYSSIFNEILFGTVSDLILYIKNLNSRFLFETIDIANEYVKLHQKLADDGADVESYYPMSIYAIWKLTE